VCVDTIIGIHRVCVITVFSVTHVFQPDSDPTHSSSALNQDRLQLSTVQAVPPIIRVFPQSGVPRPLISLHARSRVQLIFICKIYTLVLLIPLVIFIFTNKCYLLLPKLRRTVCPTTTLLKGSLVQTFGSRAWFDCSIRLWYSGSG